MEFRTLNADEIEVRVARISTKKQDGKDVATGLSLLLYKDARCDQNILDESVGCMNWQRHHTRDNRNCIVSIWDEEKAVWVDKEDTGTESNTEKEKGLASDSFKRACFNWGIGRELYTAPFIWVKNTDCDIKDLGGRFACYDNFTVEEIGYSDSRKINKLVIKNNTSNKVVFALTTSDKSPVAPDNAPSENVPESQQTKFKYKCGRLQVKGSDILKQAGWNTGDEVTADLLDKAIQILSEIEESRNG